MPNETALAQQEPLQPAVRRYALKTSAPPRKGLVDYDRDLSEEQRAVALCDPRPTLVIAGAGSGKTRALTFRVAHLLETGTAPETILLLTFTNKAAREMMTRVGQLCRVETRRMWGGTFHHVAHGLLREHASRLGYADRFGLLDREDSKEVMASATADLGYGVGQRRFPRPDALIDLYSSAINTQRPLAEVIALESPQFVALEEEIVRVARRFAERTSRTSSSSRSGMPSASSSVCSPTTAALRPSSRWRTRRSPATASSSRRSCARTAKGACCPRWSRCATCTSRRNSWPSASSSCARKAFRSGRWPCCTARIPTRWSCRWSWRGAEFRSGSGPGSASSSRRTSRTCWRTSSSSRTRRTSCPSSGS